MVKAPEFAQLMREAVGQVPVPSGWSWFHAGVDVELRSDASWFTVGLRGDAGVGGLNLKPRYGVLFHPDLWDEVDWITNAPIVASLNTYESGRWLEDVVSGLKFVVGITEEDIRVRVLDYALWCSWEEVRAYVQLVMGDYVAAEALLTAAVARGERSESNDVVRARAARAKAALAHMAVSGPAGVLKSLLDQRNQLQEKPAWTRYSIVKGQ